MRRSPRASYPAQPSDETSTFDCGSSFTGTASPRASAEVLTVQVSIKVWLRAGSSGAPSASLESELDRDRRPQVKNTGDLTWKPNVRLGELIGAAAAKAALNVHVRIATKRSPRTKRSGCYPRPNWCGLQAKEEMSCLLARCPSPHRASLSACDHAAVLPSALSPDPLRWRRLPRRDDLEQDPGHPVSPTR